MTPGNPFVRAFEILVLVAVSVVMIAAAPGAALGAEEPARQATQRELIPGAEWMTPAERDAYRRRMQAAATPEEKARIRAEYVGAAEKAAAARPLSRSSLIA